MNTTQFPRMHVSLYVSDIAKTIQFYDRFFAQEPSKVKDNYAKYELASPSLIISFIENADRINAGFGHLGFQVETAEELNTRLEAARQYDLVHLEEVGTACCYAVQDKFWSEDPDGYRWEVYYFHEDVAFNDPRYADEDTAACCMPPKKKMTIAEVAQCDPKSGCC